jgi:hypothetical protein
MDRAAIGRFEQRIDQNAKQRFPGAVRQVAVLQYGDDPLIEPGELLVRVVIEAAGEREDQKQALRAFEKAHEPAIKQFRQELSAELTETLRLEFHAGGDTGPGIVLLGRPRGAEAGELTPVMARLGPVDLETLDTLITAGIAANRAEAVRWALARIRERPAYAQLLDRVREIDELKAQF